MERLNKSLPCLKSRGQGVYTLQDIKKGEMLELAPVIPVPAVEWRLVSQTVLRHYGYFWGKEQLDGAIALGWGSLFRSSSVEPAAYYVNYPDEFFMEFFAARDIEQGEEITVNRTSPGQQGPGKWLKQGRLGTETWKVSVKNSPGKGRGVFAERPIDRDELIERVAVLIIPAGEWNSIEKTVLSNYWFSYGPNKEHAAIAMGYGSLYNHSYTPNGVYEVKEGEMVVQFKALREIWAGEEIMINYNRDPRDRSPVWFDVI